MALIVKGGGGGGSGSGDCTATKAYVLAGKTAITSDSDDEPIEGTMVNRGAVSTSIGVGGSYTIPAGYHNGSGKVTGPTLSGNAAAANVLTGKTFYSNSGTKQTGTMANQGAVSKSLSINGSYTIPAGYHNGSGKVTQSITVKAAATYTPGTSNQTIAAGQYLNGAQTIKGDANLVAANIVNGKSIFGVSGTAQKYASCEFDTTVSTSRKTFGEFSCYYFHKSSPGFTPSGASAYTTASGYPCSIMRAHTQTTCNIWPYKSSTVFENISYMLGCTATSAEVIYPCGMSSGFSGMACAGTIVGYT